MHKNSKLDWQNSEHKQGHHVVRSTSEKVNVTLPTYKGDFFAASVRGTGTQLPHDFSYPVRLFHSRSTVSSPIPATNSAQSWGKQPEFHNARQFLWQTPSPSSDVKTFTKDACHRELSKEMMQQEPKITQAKPLAQGLPLHKLEFWSILLTKLLKKQSSVSQL